MNKNKVRKVTIEPYHTCPQNCRFCSSDEVDTGCSRLDGGTIRDFITKYNPDCIRWSGGEPTSSMMLQFYVNAVDVSSIDAEQSINTCGQFAFSNWEDTFNKVDRILFSVLGGMTAHDYYSGGTHFGVCVDNIMKCKSRLDDTEIMITTPFFNVESLKKVLDVGYSLGVKVKVHGMVYPDGKEVGRDCSLHQLIDYKEFKDDVDSQYDDILVDTCSIAHDKPCKREEKRGLLPNGEEYGCAIEKIGYCEARIRKNDDAFEEHLKERGII